MESDKISRILEAIRKVWTLGETRVNDLINSQPGLFPVKDIAGIAEGSNDLWSAEATPHRAG